LKIISLIKKYLLGLTIFIGLSNLAYSEEQKTLVDNEISTKCDIIDLKIPYSKENSLTFFNGKNAYDVEAYDSALKVLKPLAKLGHKRAQTGMGLMYLYGDGLTKDEKKAIEWFKKASCQNYDWALYHLGTSYYYGRGVAKNYKLSFEYYQKASLQNNASAFLVLGHLYGSGRGVEKDNFIAVKNYKKALDLGDLDAAFFLGEIYYSGDQVVTDLVTALMWFNVAELSGDNAAVTLIEYLENQLTLEDVLEAKEMADKCISSDYKLCDVRRL
jgi:hypothetical protein